MQRLPDCTAFLGRFDVCRGSNRRFWFSQVLLTNGTAEIIDAREFAPSGATEKMYKGTACNDPTADRKCNFMRTCYCCKPEKNAQGFAAASCRNMLQAQLTRPWCAGNATLAVKGALAIAVPLELRGLQLLHSRHGSLPWAELIEPVRADGSLESMPLSGTRQT